MSERCSLFPRQSPNTLSCVSHVRGWFESSVYGFTFQAPTCVCQPHLSPVPFKVTCEWQASSQCDFWFIDRGSKKEDWQDPLKSPTWEVALNVPEFTQGTLTYKGPVNQHCPSIIYTIHLCLEIQTITVSFLESLWHPPSGSQIIQALNRIHNVKLSIVTILKIINIL